MREDGKPWQLAVVEDDDSLRNAIIRMLKACQWHAVGFSTAEDFLSVAEWRDIDCLVLDLYLPGMSGFDLLAEIKDLGTRIPTILITAQDNTKIRLRVQNVGALYLPKPFTGASLMTMVQKCMGAPITKPQ